MKLVLVNNENKRKMLDFYKKQYLNNPLKRNSLYGLFKGLVTGKSELCKSTDLEPLMVMDGERIIMICILAYAHRMPEMLQIGFFEAEKHDKDAFELILDRAETSAKEKGAKRISASLNIHVNNGLGFLASDYDKKQSFGMAHNPAFYHNFFEDNGFEAIEMVSYKKDVQDMEDLFNHKLQNRLKQNYKVRPVNFKNLKDEAKLYTEINNKAFKDHLFYYPRKPEEDLELFKDFQYLLKPENLIFVEKHGEAIGFMLWYPDFHQLMKMDETIGLSTVIKNKLFPNKIDTFKIVEMGVIPEEQNKGGVLALFNYCHESTKGKYNYCESGWILSDNNKSKAFGIKWGNNKSKEFKAYIKELI